MVGWASMLVTACLAGTPAAGERPLWTDARTPNAAAATAAAAPAPATANAMALPDLTHLAQAAVPGVVGVVTLQGAPAAKDDALKELLDKLHDSPRKGIGSGFVIHRDGWILTNAHVIEGAERVEVDLDEGRPRVPAKVMGSDSESDIALVKIEPPHPLTVLPLGDSDRLSLAEWVMVIGSPFGLDHTVTVGIVSHTGRSDISPVGRPGFYDFIQTDASINPGNSGGPMLNLKGEVVAIATAVNATGQGIGFAIPINMAKEIVGQLRARGRVVRSWLGVSVREAPAPAPAVADPNGVLVTDVTAGGPAAAAGVKPGDVITAFEGRAVKNPGRLRWYVSTAGVGREVEVKVKRGASERLVKVELAAVPAQEQARAAAAEATEKAGAGGN